MDKITINIPAREANQSKDDYAKKILKIIDSIDNPNPENCNINVYNSKNILKVLEAKKVYKNQWLDNYCNIKLNMALNETEKQKQKEMAIKRINILK